MFKSDINENMDEGFKCYYVGLKLVKEMKESIRKLWEGEEKIRGYLGNLKVTAKFFDEELVQS